MELNCEEVRRRLIEEVVTDEIKPRRENCTPELKPGMETQNTFRNADNNNQNIDTME